MQRVFKAAPQGTPGGVVQLAEQRVSPAVPECRVGAAHVGHGQQEQIVQACPVGHLAGEVIDHVRIGYIPALCNMRHQQVMFNQPGNQVLIVVAQLVPFEKRLCLNCAQFGMVATASLADVVEKTGQVQQFGFGNGVGYSAAQRELVGTLLDTEAAQIAYHEQGVFIHRVGVKQIVLHLPHNQFKGRVIGCQYAVAVHAPQLVGQTAWLAEYFHEQAA